MTIALIVIGGVAGIVAGWFLAEVRPGIPVIGQLFGGGRFVLTTVVLSIGALTVGWCRRRSRGAQE